ncbi:MAG: hypothetical protein V4713_03920 [Pseudomonadota bacterium]
MTMDLLFLAGIISAAIIGWWHWEHNVKQTPFEEFGPEVVKRVLSFESDAFRKSILKRGSMTRAQWIKINTSQIKAIEAELQRRKVEK